MVQSPQAYVVLARKWRPAKFIDIVGQGPIVRTLNNAIRTQRIHQAYLFTGSRGIGKTSIARIFAKVIRCENTREENGFLVSCDQCSNCLEIATGRGVDVLEIDGASNNGVEAIREIRENARYSPTTGTRKIYIIDEVHMLTTAAFNALLKTLEEPPAHVIFIFATTEPHKIPATILSRCQRFDYRCVTVSQIQTRLSEIALAEGIQIEAGAVALIARAAAGSMRDGLSLLDQVIAFSGAQVSVQQVRESIGLIENQVLLGIMGGIFKRLPSEALRWVEQADAQGHDLRVLTKSLLEILHSALLLKVGHSTVSQAAFSASAKLPAGSVESVNNNDEQELAALVQCRELEEMELIFQVFHQGLEWVARSSQPKIILDVLVIKCATAEALVYLDSVPMQSPAIPPMAGIGAAQGSSSAAGAIPSSVHPVSVGLPTGGTPIAKPLPPVTPKKKTWEGLIDHVRRSRPLLASILEHSVQSQVPDFEGPTPDRNLLICFSPQEAYFREQLQSKVYQEQLHFLSKEYLGSAIRLQIELKNTGESLLAKKERAKQEFTVSIQEKVQTHPIVVEARSLFGGELGPIEIREGHHAGLST